MLEKMAAEAVRELNEIRRPGVKAGAKEWAKSLIGRGNALGSDRIFWPAGLLLLGLAEAGYSAEAEAYLAEWIRKGSVVQNPDDALSGAVLLTLSEQTGKPDYRKAAGKIADYLKGCLRDADGAIVYGQRSGNSWIYADGAGQTAMFLARYAMAGGSADPVRKETAAAGAPGAADPVEEPVFDPMQEARRQLVCYARRGMDVRSGLPYHGYDVQSGVKYGIIGWGRAVGWLLLGLSEYLMMQALVRGSAVSSRDCPSRQNEAAPVRESGGPAKETGKAPCSSPVTSPGDGAEWSETVRQEDDEIARMAQELCRAVRERIRPDGLLSWQLDCVDGPLDTSATGMVFYSLLRMNRFREEHPQLSESALSRIPQTDPALIDAAASGLARCVAEDGSVWWCSGECIDFAQYRQQYGHYPWGQGAVLAFESLYMRGEK